MWKYLFLSVLIMAEGLSLAQTAQDYFNTSQHDFYFDEEDNEVPVCLTRKYRDAIDLDQLKVSYSFGHINNDSMYQVEYDAEYFERMAQYSISSSYSVQKDVELNFKERATRIPIDEGTLWIFRLNSVTAHSLGAIFEPVILPSGARFTYFTKDCCKDAFAGVYLADGSAMQFGWSIQTSFNNEYENRRLDDIYLEYFEPADAAYSPDLIIKKLIYGYGNQVKQRLESMSPFKGGYGDLAWQCNNDVVCGSLSHWQDCAKGVCFIYVYNEELLPGQRIRGSGVFLNKGGDGYTPSDKPYILSAAHLFGMEKEGVPLVLLHDHIRTQIEIIVNYQYGRCGQQNQYTVGRQAALLTKSNIKAIGNNYWVNPNSPNYDPKNDYVLLQSSNDMKKLSKFDITYAAWEAWSLPGRGAAIGHPAGDVKRVLVDYQNPSVSPNGTFLMDWDIGVSEPGLSGAPVFASDGLFNVQGIVLSESSGINKSCGNSSSTCLDFAYLYDRLSQFLSSDGVAISALNRNYSTEITFLPSHCGNCILDGNETLLDCGGDCLPCGIADNTNITKAKDVLSRPEIKSRFSTSINSGTLTQMKGGSMSIKSGESISLKGVEFQKGATLQLALQPELTSEPNSRGCFTPCVFIPSIITHNGDGANDFLVVTQSFVRKWSVRIYNRSGKVIYNSDTETVEYDGRIAIWDGLGGSSFQAYRVDFTYADCNNKWYTIQQMVNLIK